MSGDFFFVKNITDVVQKSIQFNFLNSKVFVLISFTKIDDFFSFATNRLVNVNDFLFGIRKTEGKA